MSWLVRNWHLKLGALALATVLYTGFVYSGSFSENSISGIPVVGINQPDAVYPLTQDLGTVDIDYRIATDADVRIQPDSFSVTVDLSDYDMDLAPSPQSLPIRVRPVGDGLDVMDYTPKTVAVQIDRIGQKEVPVVVDRGTVPDGLAIGTPQVSESTVVAIGPESKLSLVERAVARVQIFASGIDVNRQVDLQAVDVDGRQVDLVELDPGTVNVSIDVRTVETTKTVPVRPILTGSVADGYEITGVVPRPSVVTLFGQPDVLAAVEEVRTQAISIAGLTSSTSLETQLQLPAETRLAPDTEGQTVRITVQAATASRTFLVGLGCDNVADSLACLPAIGQLSLVLSGPAATLASIQAGDLVTVVDVSGLGPGRYSLSPEVTLPPDTELVSISPGTVSVTLTAPATPTPSPSPPPT